MSKSSSQGVMVKLLALSENPGPGCPSYRYIEMTNVDGVTTRLLVPSAILDSIPKLKDLLVSNGYPPGYSQKHWQALRDVLSAPCAARVKLVKRPGWGDNSYLDTNGAVIGTSDHYGPLLSPDTSLRLPSAVELGTRQDWEEKVAVLALHSSRLMLALCASISGLVIRFADVESGGFHFYGDSSIGKSSCLRFAASVYGDADFIESWDTTDKAFEEIAEAHNDSVLILDELKLLHRDPRLAAERAAKLVYQVADGKGKKRASGYQAAPSEWKLVLLSAGELSLNQHAASGGIDRMAGEQVRVVDVPADAGKGLGIYESLPEGIATPAELAELLASQCTQFYGTAKRSLVLELARRLVSKPGVIQKVIERYKKRFMKIQNAHGLNGQQNRIAKRFAFAYAAGALAVNYKALPFTRRQVMEGISVCYQAAVDAVPESFEQKLAAARKLVKSELHSSRIKDLCDMRTRQDIEYVSGFRTRIKDKDIIALKPEAFNELIEDEVVRNAILKYMVSEGVLFRDSCGKSTRQLSHKVEGRSLPRCYCFDRAKLPA